jgi:hypothetical protein
MSKITTRLKQLGLIVIFMTIGAFIWAHYSNQIKSVASDTRMHIYKQAHDLLEGMMND